MEHGRTVAILLPSPKWKETKYVVFGPFCKSWPSYTIGVVATKRRIKMQKIIFRIAVGLLIAVCSIVSLEFVLQEVVTYALRQGRLFSQDAIAGWSVRKNLDVTRRNPGGKKWDIKTGECGYRGPCDWSSEADRRLLVLGDSFAFGEGVSLEERFDSHLARAFPRWSIVNLGVMGYGTDQEILVSRPFVSRMRRSDIVLLIIYGNDFFDILRKSLAGRPKPWFELTDAGVIEHPPTFLWLDYIRDRSYLAAVSGRLAERSAESYTTGEIEESLRLFEVMLGNEINRWSANDIEVVLARHGTALVTAGRPVFVERRLTDVWETLCKQRYSHCTDLDPVLARGGLLQTDGHWNAEGHYRISHHLQVVLGGLAVE